MKHTKNKYISKIIVVMELIIDLLFPILVIFLVIIKEHGYIPQPFKTIKNCLQVLPNSVLYVIFSTSKYIEVTHSLKYLVCLWPPGSSVGTGK